MSVSSKIATGPDGVARELAALFHHLGFAAMVRDPLTAEVVAASPRAEEELGAAGAGEVKVASARIGGEAVRVEVVRTEPNGTLHLTPRQTAVARLLVKGRTNTEIAEELNISAHTVRRHLEAIFRRLEVPNRASATAELKRGRVHL
jgi:DNA-binding NarL/FixJ family response regulator